MLSSRKRTRLDVRLVEDGAGRTLAILPFFEEALAGSVARITQFIGHRMSDHNDILLVDPKSSELADEVIRVLFEDPDSGTILHLRHLDGGSMFTKRLLVSRVAEPQCTHLYLQADPAITDQRKRLGPTKRKNLRWQENLIRRQFKIQFRVRSGTDFLDAFDEMIDLHYRRFDAKGHSTSLTGPSLAFLRTATSTLSNTGNFEIIQLRTDDTTIAAVLTAYSRRRYFGVQSGFNPEFSRFSPIRLLQVETMRRGFEDLDCEIFDLGTGYDQYKFEWSPIVDTNYMCCYGGTGLYGKLAANLYRAAFLRSLPPSQGPQTT